MEKISSMISSTSGEYYETELRLSFPSFVDIGRITSGMKCTHYIEETYQVPYSKTKIRRRIKPDGRETVISKSTVHSVFEQSIKAKIAFSREVSEAIPERRPANVVEYRRYIQKGRSIKLDIKESEGSYRVEIELIGDDYEQELSTVLRELYSSLMGCSFPVTLDEFYCVRGYINSPGYCTKLNLLTDSCNKPVHIDMYKLARLRGKWFVTPKIDGIRNFIIVCQYGTYRCGRDGIIHKIEEKEHPLKEHCLLDCELLDGRIYVIDAVYSGGKSLSLCSLEERLEICKIVVPSLCVNASVKEYLPCNSLTMEETISRVLDSDDCDGIILTSNLGYDHIQYKIKKYTTYDLVYKGGVFVTSDGVSYGPPNIFGYEEDAVYECVLSGGIQVLKKREDKLHANSSKVIEQSSKCLALRNIYEKDYFMMAKYHNCVKLKMLSLMKVDEKAYLLDIGTGSGGDISKWRNYEKVYCVERNSLALKSLRRRCNNKMAIISSDISKHRIVMRSIDYQITNVSVYFSLMMFDAKALAGLISVMEAKCHDDCTIQIISMDGEYAVADGNIIRDTGNGCLSVTIPGTKINDNAEYRTDVRNVIRRLERLGFEVVTNRERIPDHPCLSERAYRLSSYFTITEMMRGNHLHLRGRKNILSEF
jgi:hypothetical protein